MTADAFFDALRADPDDDTTRLVYADWLDEQGEADRAGFIRLAVRLERLREDHPARPTLLSRYNDLRLTHGPAWLGQRPDSLEDVGYHVGLVCHAVFRDNAPVAEIESFLARHPIRTLTVGGEKTVRDLARSPVLERIRCLVVRHGLGRRRARLLDELFNSPFWRQLDELHLAGEVVDNHLARVLVSTLALGSLRALRLDHTRLDDAGVVHLLEPPALPHLEEWHVDCGGATWISLERLFEPARAGRWRALLWLEPRTYPPANLDGLRRCEQLRRLSVVFRFRLAFSRAMLGWLDDLPRLEQLTLAGPLDLGTVADLAAWPGLARLERLELQPRYTPSLAERERMRRWLQQSPHYQVRTKIAIPGLA